MARISSLKLSMSLLHELQLLHLLLAQVMWLLLVLLFFSHQADFSSATGGKPA